MRLTCPSCAATYEVPDTLHPMRRRIRCSACGMEWLAEPEEPAPEPPPPEPEPLPVPVITPRSSLFQPPRPNVPPPPPRRSAGLVIAWIVTLLLLIALAVGAYVQRAAVMKAWPPSARLYTALGVGPQ